MTYAKPPRPLTPFYMLNVYSLAQEFQDCKTKVGCIIMLNKALHENEITSKSWEMSSG